MTKGSEYADAMDAMAGIKEHCKTSGCKKIHMLKQEFCVEHKCHDNVARGRVSLKALGFKMAWKLVRGQLSQLVHTPPPSVLLLTIS
jgi:hypothetical protein